MGVSMKIRNRLPGLRLFSGFMLTMIMTGCLTIVLNIVFLCIMMYNYRQHYSDDIDYISGGAVMEELSLAGNEYGLSDGMERRLRESNHWAMLLDENGKVVWSFDKPEELADSYTRSDIARMSRWYLHDYPVNIRVWEERIMVVGRPKNTVWKYNLEFPEAGVRFIIAACLWMLFLNFLWVLALSFVFTRRWSKSREQARIEWISGISHDIRTPLSMVMGYSDTLTDSGNLSDAERHQTAVIRHQSMVMKELVEDLNLTSRLEYSMQPLRVEWVRPAAVLREVAAAFLSDAKEGELQIEMEISDQAQELWVRADRKLFIRALRNLFHNSLQHNDCRQTMVIGLRMWREGKWCLIRFTDNGAGYCTEALRQLQSRKRKRSMQNIRGLGIVCKSVEAHGGKIRFENRKEGGSICEIRLRGSYRTPGKWSYKKC